MLPQKACHFLLFSHDSFFPLWSRLINERECDRECALLGTELATKWKLTDPKRVSTDEKRESELLAATLPQLRARELVLRFARRNSVAPFPWLFRPANRDLSDSRDYSREPSPVPPRAPCKSIHLASLLAGVIYTYLLVLSLSRLSSEPLIKLSLVSQTKETIHAGVALSDRWPTSPKGNSFAIGENGVQKVRAGVFEISVPSPSLEWRARGARTLLQHTVPDDKWRSFLLPPTDRSSPLDAYRSSPSALHLFPRMSSTFSAAFFASFPPGWNLPSQKWYSLHAYARTCVWFMSINFIYRRFFFSSLCFSFFRCDIARAGTRWNALERVADRWCPSSLLAVGHFNISTASMLSIYSYFVSHCWCARVKNLTASFISCMFNNLVKYGTIRNMGQCIIRTWHVSCILSSFVMFF